MGELVWPDTRLVTFLAYVVVALLVSALAFALAGRRSRAVAPIEAILAFCGAYLAMRVGAKSGFTDWLDHEVFEPVGGSIDDFPTWLVAFGGAVAVLAVRRLRR